MASQSKDVRLVTEARMEAQLADPDFKTSIKGDTGPAPVVTAGTTTQVSSGAPAEVTITSTGEGRYRADFKIPRGLDGDPSGVADLSAAMASEINTEGSAPRNALNAATEPMVHSAVATRAPILGSDLIGFYAALSQRRTNPVDIVVCGDSIFEGFGASSLSTRFSAVLTAALRAKYPTSGVAGGYGFIPAFYESTNLQALGPKLTGNTAKDYSSGLGGRTIKLGADTGTGLGNIEFKFTGTSFKILAKRRVTTTGTDQVAIYVDSGAAQTWQIDNDVDTDTVAWTSPTLASGAHTVAITAKYGLSSIEGIMVYNGDENAGIRVWDAARSGSMATNFGGTAWLSSLSVAAPDLVLIEWMTNDYMNKTPAEYKADLQWVANNIRSTVPNVPLLFTAMFERGAVGKAPWPEYRDAMRDVAAGMSSAAFFDFGEYVPKLAGTGGANPYALLHDTTHLNDKGQAVLANTLVNSLAAVV